MSSPYEVLPVRDRWLDGDALLDPLLRDMLRASGAADTRRTQGEAMMKRLGYSPAEFSDLTVRVCYHLIEAVASQLARGHQLRDLRTAGQVAAREALHLGDTPRTTGQADRMARLGPAWPTVAVLQDFRCGDFAVDISLSGQTPAVEDVIVALKQTAMIALGARVTALLKDLTHRDA